MLNVNTPVWGDMTQAYLDVALPCLINNFQKCPEEIDVYTIYTTERDRTKIEASERYREVRSLVPVEFQPLPKGEWEVTSTVLQEFRRGQAEGHYVLQLTASCSLGDDCISNVSHIIQAGKNPIFYPDIKMSPQGWEAIREYIRVHGHLPNRVLMSIGMKHILPAHHTVVPIGPELWEATLKVFSMIVLPDQRIIDLWESNPTVGSGYDHVLPYFCVTQGFPFYVIPHSDVYQTGDGEIGPPDMKFGQGLWRPDLSRAGEQYFQEFKVTWQGEG